MESVRRNFLNGFITEKEYQKSAIIESVTYLNNSYLHFKNILGSGSYGTVVEVEHPAYGEFATKIVLNEYVSRSEEEIWPLLQHDNILPVLEIERVPSAYTCLFVMPKHPIALNKVVEDPTFYTDINAFDRAFSYLKGIAQGVKYLHDQNLCHLDLKLCNVLITEENKPVICDFGSLTRTDGATNNYTSPFIYGAPEANISKKGAKVTVDGFKFDIYTLGILALELFTKESVLKSSEWEDDDPSWAEVMYSRIFDILEKESFVKRVKSTFFMADIKDKTVMRIRNFILGCICLNPSNRPSIVKVLDHKILGGKNKFPIKTTDVWEKRAELKKIQFLVSIFIGRAVALEMKGFLRKFGEQKDAQSNVQSKDDNHKVHSDASLDESVPNLNRKQQVLRWVTRKKNNFNKMLNRVLGRFRK